LTLLMYSVGFGVMNKQIKARGGVG
jgi:hypothetical protein